MTGAKRRISSSGVTGFAAMLLAAAPRSTTSAPAAANWRATAIAIAGSRLRPPSENESSVMLRIPKSFGPLIRASFGPAAFENRADPIGIGENIELLDRHPHLRDARIGEARLGDALREAFAQINVPAIGDIANRRHDLFVIDHPAPVLARKSYALGGGQLDRDTHPL